MKVILLQDIKGVGKKEQLIEASDGYARNFLFPKKLAVEASKDNVNKLEAKKKTEENKRVKELEEARELKTLLETKVIKISSKTGENGRLFGSITNKEIAAALEEQEHIAIDKKKITIIDPIKKVGEHKVEVKVHSDVTAKLTVLISQCES